METNWNQLIERYLENELSEEGRQAFEAELAGNSELRAELDIHQTVRDGAARSAQRLQLASIGASYHRSVRMKQVGVAAAIVVGVGVTAAVLLLNGKGGTNSVPQEQQEQTTEVQESPVAELQPIDNTEEHTESGENTVRRAITYRLAQNDSNLNTFLDLVKMDNENAGVSLQKDPVEEKPVTGIRQDGSIVHSDDDGSLQEQLYDTVVRRGFPSRELMLVKKDNSYGIANGEGYLVVVPKYDSIGKFDDLIPCLAVVMDEGKFGFINKTGKEVIPLMYDQIVENAKYRRKYVPGLRGGLGLFHRKKPRTFYIFAGENTTSYCDQ